MRCANARDGRDVFKDAEIGVRACIAAAALEVAAAYSVASALRDFRPPASLVVINFATSLSISLGLEFAQLAAVHQCCCCCPLDDDPILEEADKVDSELDLQSFDRALSNRCDSPSRMPGAF